ncbi:replication termination factor 2 [Podospora fimiseda]|uniref:Replication termination factor 2 n=1 Tax=Podospora fimiseda TaxID=252190 RepID=A0AAN7BI62_9PEZI|nr:replication termination factor 2 [Podospora fimiseda]
MGNDGGSIPKRRELVKSAARAPTVSELKATALESLSHAWSYDPLSSDPLDMENAVSDWRGRLYNYESILKGLMPGDSSGENNDATPPALVDGESQELSFPSTGIKSLRDIVKLKIKRYAPPGGKKGDEIWACPVTLKELGASTKAVYIVPCGHVFAEVAIKQIQEEACPECSEAFKSRDIIPILPTEQSDLEKLTARLDSLKEEGLTHSLKKDKSNGKKKRKVDEANSNEGVDGATKTVKGVKESRKEKDAKNAPHINNPMTASLTAKVMAEQEARNKRRKMAAAAER